MNKNIIQFPLVRTSGATENPQESIFAAYKRTPKYKRREVPQDRQTAEAQLEGYLAAVVSCGGFSGGQYGRVRDAIANVIAAVEKDGFSQGVAYQGANFSPVSSK